MVYQRPARYIDTSPLRRGVAGPSATLNFSRIAARNASGDPAGEILDRAVVRQDLHLVVRERDGDERLGVRGSAADLCLSAARALAALAAR